jgi:hypothetical protein
VKLTERMIAILRVLDREPCAMVPNSIAYRLGFQTGQDHNRHARDGRAMAPAQRVIFPLIVLQRHGLISHARRPDGLSGTAYAITAAGRQTLKGLAPA